jgi:Tol biopolymer transport system component
MSRRVGVGAVVVTLGIAAGIGLLSRETHSLCRAGSDPRPADAPPPPEPTGRPGEGAVWVVGIDGSNPTPLPVKVGPYAFAWSPDRSRLAYIAAEGSLVVVNADGSGERVILEGGRPSSLGAYANYPAWSPDGKRIAFSSIGIQVINADGSQRTRLTSPGAGDPANEDTAKQPAWSPDGSRIVFNAQSLPVTSSERLEIMNADGTNRRVLTADHRFRLGQPSWSPDGTRIAFRASGGYYGSWMGIISPEGKGLRRVGEHCSGGHPAWSPDGKKIAFTDNYSIILMDADGSRMTRVPNTCDGYSPSWSADGKKLFFLRG